jgi:thiol:disulfide interchange protein
MIPSSLRVPRASRLLAALVTAVLPLVLSLVAASTASAQTRAHAQLYVRVEGDDVKAAVQVRLDPGFHLFHGPGPKDMGSEGAAGIPTTIEFVGAGFTWSAPRFPEPEKEDQSFLGTGVYANVHFGTPTIWFRGKKSGDADASKLQAKINGQTCDPMGCVPYSETVASSGPGSDKLFGRFPADLVVAAAAAPAAAPASQTAPDGADAIDASRKHVHPTLYVREEGDELRAVLQLVIDPGYHIYHGPEKKDVGPGDSPLGLPTRVTMLGERVLWQPVVFPAPKRVEEPSLQTWYLEHDGTVVLTVRGKKAAGADVAKLSAKVEGQVCKTSCDQFSETVANSGRGPDALFAKAAEAASDPVAVNDDDVANVPMWKFLALAVGWAIFSLLMPCTYPMIPITISFFTKQSAARNASTLSLSIVYGLGIVLSFVGIGVLVGPPIAAFAASPWTNLVIFAIFLAFGLSLLGLFILQPPQFLMGFASTATQKGGLLGVFLMGLTLCVTSFTCMAPFVGSLLVVGAKGGGLGRLVLGMATFGFVMAVPFVFLSMLPAKAKQLPKSGEWVHSLKVTLGFIELAAAVKFLSNCDLVWKWNALSREIVLMLWSATLMAAAFYVWGVITLKEDVEIRGADATPGIGPKRLVIGTALFLLAMYFLLGAFGAQLDSTTETLAPNYSKPLFTSGTGPGAHRGGDRVASGPIKDDWEAALAKAQAEHKLLAINFTGDV